MSDLLKLILLVYVSGLSGYLLAVLFGVFIDKKTPNKTKVAAILCAPIWPLIVAAIMYRRSK